MGSTAKEGDQEVFVLTWNDFHTQFVSSFQEMRGEGDFLDTTVACSSGDNHQLQAHKVVLSASSPFFKSMLKNNPAQHPVLVMPPEVKFQDLVRVFEFIYCGVVKVQSHDVESFMNVANLLKIRGLTEDHNKGEQQAAAATATAAKTDSKQSDSSSNKARPQQPPVAAAAVAGGSGSKQPRRRNSSQSSTAEGATAGAPANKKFRDYEPPTAPQQAAASQDPQQMEEGSGDGAYTTSYSEYDNVYADQQFEEETPAVPSTVGGSSNGAAAAAGPNIQLKGLVCPMCHNVCHDVPSLKMHMSTAHGVAKEEESPQKQKPPRKNQKHPNSSPALERTGSQQMQGTPGGANDEAVNCDICYKTHKNIKAMKAHQRKYHRAELGLPEAGEVGAAGDAYEDPHLGGIATPSKKGGRGRGRGKGGRGAAQAAAAARAAAAQAAADAAMYQEGMMDGDYYGDPMVEGADPDDPDGVGMMPVAAARGRGRGRGVKRRGGRVHVPMPPVQQPQYDEDEGLEEDDEDPYYEDEDDGLGGGDDDGVIMNKPVADGHARKEKPVGEVQPAPRLKSPDAAQQPKAGTSRPAPKRPAAAARQPRAPGAKHNKQLQQRFGSQISITSGPSGGPSGSGGRMPANLPPGVSVTKTGAGRLPPQPPPPPARRPAANPSKSMPSGKRGAAAAAAQAVAVKEEPSSPDYDDMDDQEEEEEYYDDDFYGDEGEEYAEGLEGHEGGVASGNVDGSYDNYMRNNEDLEDDDDEEDDHE